MRARPQKTGKISEPSSRDMSLADGVVPEALPLQGQDISFFPVSYY